MSYTYYQAKNPTTININDEHVTESELPERFLELNNKTQNINANGTTLSNITSINNRKIGVPHGWNFVYWDYAPYIPVCDAFNGSMTVGHTIIFKDEYGEDYPAAMLTCNARGQLEIAGRFSADMYKTDVGFALRQYKNTSMKFMKYDDTTSMLTLNSLDDTATFLGNIVAPNISALEDKTQNILRIPGTDEDPTSYTEIDGVSFKTTLERISNTEGTLTKVSYDPLEELTTISGKLTVGTLNGNKIGAPNVFAYNNEVPFIPVVGSNGVMETGNRIDFHRATNEEDYTVGLEVSGLNKLTIRHTNTTYAGDLELGTSYYRNANGTCRLSSNQHSNLMWYNNSGTNTWVCDATGSPEKWSTTRDNALAAFTRTTGMTHTLTTTEPVAPANTSFAHNITSVECYSGRYHTNGTSSLPINSVASVSTWDAMRIVRTSLAKDAKCGYQFGRGNDSTLYPNNYCALYYVAPTDDLTKGEIRLGTEKGTDLPSTCISYDTSTMVTKLPGNLIVNGTVTDNGSKTITHYTAYEGDLHPGFFVESTGQLFHNGETSYENCMVTVRQATTFSSNIIGVCTEIVKEPIYEERSLEEGHIRQIIGERITDKCKFATHGDCLIKCESATYTCGDIIVPSTNGFGKKGSSTDVLNCMLSMTPRLKVTSVDTDEIDPQCVVGFITV